MADKKEQTPNDLGFGSSAKGSGRNLNADGTFNMKFIGVSHSRLFNLFHYLITLSGWKFLIGLLITFLGINLLFACLYFLIGIEHLSGIEGSTPFERFMEGFFFSTQTLTTLGYGRIAPVGTLASIVAAMESMLGLLAFAVTTGLLYGRFSRPRNSIQFSTQCVMAPYQNGRAFMFRISNFSYNQLIEVEANVNFSWHPKGAPSRSFHSLELERNRIDFFPSSWTIVHPIREGSPLFGKQLDTIKEEDIEVIIKIKAYDPSSGQMVYARRSYVVNEMEWGKKFVMLAEILPDGQRVADLSLLSVTQDAPLPD